MKGAIQPDHIGDNKYEFQVLGLVPITATSIGELTETLKTVTLPDMTEASGGTTEPVKFDIEVPAHHDVEIAAMELWYQSCKDPVLPTYKLPCTLVMPRISGAGGRTYTLVGTFITGRGIPAMKMDGDGTMQVIKYPMSCDNIVPI